MEQAGTCRPGQVECQKPGEQILAVDVCWPAVSGQYRGIEAFVGLREPGGTLVVQVGQGALLETGGGEPGRVKPAVAELDEALGGLPDPGALLLGGVREREGLEAG